MNATASPVAPTTTPAIESYAAEVRRLYAEQAAPIASIDDPRVADLVGSRPYLTREYISEYLTGEDEPGGQTAAAELAELWFERFGSIPEAPIELPSWVESRYDFRFRGRHEVEVQMVSRPFQVGEVSAHIETTMSVVVDEYTDRHGNTYPVGLYADSSPLVVIGDHELRVPVAQLADLGAVLAEIAVTLTQEVPR